MPDPALGMLGAGQMGERALRVASPVTGPALPPMLQCWRGEQATGATTGRGSERPGESGLDTGQHSGMPSA